MQVGNEKRTLALRPEGRGLWPLESAAGCESRELVVDADLSLSSLSLSHCRAHRMSLGWLSSVKRHNCEVPATITKKSVSLYDIPMIIG